MRRSDIHAVGDVAGEALAAGGTFIKEMHEGIASRPFAMLGSAAAPARLLHDGISKAVYAGVRGGLYAASVGGSRALGLRASEDGPALDETLRGSLVLGAINGAFGNHLDERRSPLALGMQVRRRGRAVTLDFDGLQDAYPDATSRLVVFVHGLCETDEAWRIVPRREQRDDWRPYGDRLQDELSFTPVYLRYNTGLRISRNGRTLAGMLEELVEHWPRTVEEVVLVGHSMGGLVARSACHYAERDGLRWTDVVRHVFCLGTPHLGADLEKGANVAAHALSRLPETRALGTALKKRSVGIKDLRFGSCVDEDWSDCDPDEYLRDRCQEVPFLPDATYYFVGASLKGPLGRLVGDLLVRMPSASGRGNGRGRRIPFEVDNGHELSGVNHFDLLNHPAVYEQLRMWITRRPPAREPRALLTA